VSVDPARGHRAVSVTSWVWALAVGTLGFVGAVVPILSFVPICAISAVHAACYSGAAGCVTVALATWVVTLYSRVFVDHFGELASSKEPE
jgi:hypothetical protein